MSNKSKYEIWKERVNDYRSSNLNEQEWCDKNNLPLTRLRYWITKFNEEDAISNSSLNEFIPVNIPEVATNTSAPVVIRLGNISIDISENCHPDILRNILEVIGKYA